MPEKPIFTSKVQKKVIIFQKISLFALQLIKNNTLSKSELVKFNLLLLK